MAYKTFLSATGSGNLIFEGDILNGHITPKGQSVSLKIFSNDRGYSCAAFELSPTDAKALRDELETLLTAQAEKAGVFEAESSQKRFGLSRETDGGALILAVRGTDARFGTSYHRGNLDALKAVVTEFDQVLKTLQETVAGANTPVAV